MLDPNIPPIKEKIPEIKIDESTAEGKTAPDISKLNNGASVLVITLAVVSIVLTPILSNLWILLVFPIGLAVVSLILALKDFKVTKSWIVALVLALIACTNVVLTVERIIVDTFSYSHTNYYTDDYYDWPGYGYDEDNFWYGD